MKKLKYKGDRIRLDKYLAENLKNFSRSKIQKFIREKKILVNSNFVKSNYVLNDDDNVKVLDFEEGKEFQAENIDVEILYEDKDFMVVNKPAGIVVHVGEGGRHATGTLMHALLDKIDKDAGPRERLGIVHRLDKDTSGVLIVAKTKFGYDYFVKLFKERKIKKYYVALLYGKPLHDEGIIDSPIGRNLKQRKKMGITAESEGKKAVSRYRVLENFNYENKVLSLVEVDILTGRTHQIRVHMQAIDCPVVGDKAYGNKKVNSIFEKDFLLKRQFLHAEKVVFEHPKTGKKMNIKADLSIDLKNVLKKLKL